MTGDPAGDRYHARQADEHRDSCPGLSEQPRFGERYGAFLKRFRLEEIGVDDDFLDGLRDRAMPIRDVGIRVRSKES